VCPRDIGTTLGITERSVLGIVTCWARIHDRGSDLLLLI